MSDEALMTLVVYAQDAYKEYLRVNPDKPVDFHSFSIGYFLGAAAAA